MSNVSELASVTINEFISMRTEWEKSERHRIQVLNDTLKLAGIERTVVDETDYIILPSKINEL